MTGEVSQEAALLAQIARGDGDAFARLLERHGGLVRGIARAMLGSDDDADDVTQDVFLKIWQNPHGWKPGAAKYSTWLHRVTANQCLDRLRRRKKMTVHDEIPDRPDPAPGPFAALQARQRAARIETALGQLPDRQKLAVTLSHFGGYTNIEAAEIMDTSIEAVESLLSRARRTLKEILRADIENLIDTQALT